METPIDAKMTQILKVHLCVNDDHGNLTDRCCRIEFHTSDGTEAALELDPDDGAHFARTPTGFRLGDREFVAVGWKHWLGNVFWEGTSMPVESARELFTHSVGLGFSIDEWTNEGPLADLATKATRNHTDALLHPNGRCSCGGGGSGTCDWCVRIRTAE